MNRQTARVGGLVQVAQYVEDLDRAVDFYGSVLGLSLVARVDDPPMAFFDLGGTRLLLGANHYRSSLFLAVDDIDAAVRTMTVAGARFETPPRLMHTDRDGTFGAAGTEEWMAFVWDSEGTLVDLVERRRPDRGAAASP
jgi:methylmalonyl-CoA/ethylmalonyl-CoA epimerase